MNEKTLLEIKECYANCIRIVQTGTFDEMMDALYEGQSLTKGHQDG